MRTRNHQTGMSLKEWVCTLAITGLLGGGSAATADESTLGSNTGTASATDVGLQEIVVTAQKRSERLSDVPASITAVTGASLQQAGAVSYGDYLNTVPGVSYASDGGFLDKIFIRGLSDSLSSQDASTTGIYLDEAPVTESTSSIGDIGTFDVNRVEVLRGPQGTLFGESSMGGTVRIITNKPDLNNYDALVSSTLSGTEHGGLNDDVDAMVNVPLIDGTLAVRAVVGYSHNDGFIDDIATGRKDVNDLKSQRARLLVQYDPIEPLHILLSFNYIDKHQDFGPYQDLGLAQYQISRIVDEYSEYEMKLFGLTVNYDFDWATLTSATNYLDKINSYARDLTGLFLPILQSAFTTPLPPGTGVGLYYDFPNKTFSEELRLASREAGPVQWLVGAYYSLFNPYQDQFSTSNAPVTQNFNFYNSQNWLRLQQIAGFGELSYSPTSRLEFTAGFRQYHIESGDQNVGSGYLEGGSTVTSQEAVTETGHVAKYRISYKLTPDNLLYAQAAQGFRPGGAIGEFQSTGVAALHALGYATPPTQYSPDSLWDYEIGSKNSFLSGKLTISGSVYYIDWKDIQLALNLSDGEQFISNAGKATSKGFELETAAYPLTGLELHLSVAYTDATFGQTLADIDTIAGAPLPNVPRWTYSLSSVYTRPLSAEVNGYVRTDLNHVDSRINDLAGLPSGVVNEAGYTLLNLRFGVQCQGWDTALFVDNATNRVAILNTEFINPPNYQTINTPRTVGVNVRKKF
jgi:iron complex outermembrane recepter protein